jgi:hypothetical protein
MVAMSTDGVGGRLDGRRRVTYEAWADLLAEHFFRAEYQGIPVMLFVDDETVAGIYQGARDEAVSSLAAAVHSRLGRSRPRQLFHRIESETRRWKANDGDGSPPALPLLALAVLAASRMGRRRDRAATNYYEPFCDLFAPEIDRELIIVSYRDAIPYLWQSLQWWLDVKLRGSLGFSTITEDEHFTYIGYADSQTLFSNSDRDKLTQFFRWIRLKPGEKLDQSELMTYFRIWASRRSDLSEGAAHMLESDDYTAQLAQIIKAAADRWGGVVREQGRREGEILLTLELFPGRRLGLVAERPSGFPPEFTCVAPGGRQLTLISSADGWYDELELPVTTALLDHGLRLAGDDVRLRLASCAAHVLEKNPELGKWASVAQLEPGEPAWLLVRRSSLDEAAGYLSRSARDGWKVIEREGLTPEGWSLIGEVLIEGEVEDAPAGELARVVPRLQNRFSFKGGLPLPRGAGAYLLGGEPDLWLPPPASDERRVELEVDEEVVSVPPEKTHLRLAGRELGEGAHDVALEGIARSFSTVRTLGNLCPSVDRPIAHKLAVGAHAIEARSAGAQLVEPGSIGSPLCVRGAVVEDPAGELGGPPARPLILPTAALRRVILGAWPGQVQDVAAPEKPPWMVRADLDFQVFELNPPFEVVWVITYWNLEPSVRVRMKSPLPALLGTSAEDDDVARWRQALLVAPEPTELDALELWMTYRARATEVAQA